MQVMIPSVLQSYTGAAQVEVEANSLEALFATLDALYPGLRFRVIDEQDRFRRHMRCFVNGVQEFELSHPLLPQEDIAIIQALSGG